jgi:tripartite-type tricarboxylate transporter receptor subunit TctC
MGIVSRSESGWQSFGDMVAAAEGGQQIRFGVMSPKLADIAYLLGQAQNVDFNIVEVRGGRAVMDGVNAGDMDVGFMAGVQTRGVAAGDLVNLASGLSRPLEQTPEAPTLSDLGVPFNADGYFVFVAPEDIPEEARTALIAAIGDAITREGSRSNGAIVQGFGGPTIIAGEDLATMLSTEFEAAGALLAAASE